MKRLLQRFKNARGAVSQIKRGEWEIGSFDGSDLYTIRRGDYEIWVANGAFFCEVIRYQNSRCAPAFGYLFRHYVWWAASRKVKVNFKGKHIPQL